MFNSNPIDYTLESIKNTSNNYLMGQQQLIPCVAGDGIGGGGLETASAYGLGAGGNGFNIGFAGGALDTSVPPPPLNQNNAIGQSGFFKPLMQMNGRKVLGPPDNWVGPIPTSVCELFVRRIPKDIDEQKLIQQFFRFGRIYEIRLPMDFNQASRGYCYVKYTNEDDAACAMEVLSHYFVSSKKKLEILHSYEKCRLFVSNIPKHISETEVEMKLRGLFPTLEKVYARDYTANDGNGENSTNEVAHGQQGNRGYVIVQFPTHMQALEAKKCTNPGMIRMWGRDLKIVWANDGREQNANNNVKTLFIRNVDFSVNKRDMYEVLNKFVSRSEICKISKVRMSAFVDFASRDAAEICYRQLQDYTLHGRRLGVEWAKPSEQQSLHNIRNTDFDATLRLKCIANQWQIPIIIFGTYFEDAGVQYCAVMLRNTVGLTRAVFCALHPRDLCDIHSRLCEVVCILIETIGEFPDNNYVFFVEKDNAHVAGMITHNMESINFIAAHKVPKDLVLDLNELADLSTAIAMLGALPESQLLHAYHQSLQLRCPNSYLDDPIIHGYRYFGTIYPNYRNKPPLKHNLNNTQIILALCYLNTGSNKETTTRPHIPATAANFETAYKGLAYTILKLLPIALTQSKYGIDHLLSHVEFGSMNFYHPEQRIRYDNGYAIGASYAISLKQPNKFHCYMTNKETGECRCDFYADFQQQQQQQFQQRPPFQLVPQPSLQTIGNELQLLATHGPPPPPPLPAYSLFAQPQHQQPNVPMYEMTTAESQLAQQLNSYPTMFATDSLMTQVNSVFAHSQFEQMQQSCMQQQQDTLLMLQHASSSPLYSGMESSNSSLVMPEQQQEQQQQHNHQQQQAQFLQTTLN